MSRRWGIIFLAVLSCLIVPFFAFAEGGKTVLIAILARNKAHCLPKYLRCIDALDYDKKLISVYINTNNNNDNTEQLLKDWVDAHRPEYRSIIFDSHNIKEQFSSNPHDWTPKRFKALGMIRNKSMQQAKELNCDFYFVIDCDNFITPCTLKELVAKDKPIIAPMLNTIPDPKNPYSNFFCDITKSGYYKSHPDYMKIRQRQMVGTFQVPVVHCTYLIKREYIDSLGYVDGSDDYEFVIFSKSARANNVEQYICNEKDFGELWYLFADKNSLQQEKDLFLEYEASH
jgi:hypothetical protein